MSYDTMSSPASQSISNLPLRQQLRAGLKDMATRSYSSAKGFGLVGGLFAGSECCIESVGSDLEGFGGRLVWEMD